MSKDAFEEIYKVATNKDLAENGGGHNAKGIEFQKYWAIIHLLELEESGANDFLMLFEAVQDVAVLDSSSNPTSISVYQVKKKDRGEWNWSDLVAVPQPEDPSKPKKAVKKVKAGLPAKNPVDIKGSPVGKLYASIQAFKGLNSSGRFISNAGCNLLLANGSNAATSLPTILSELPAHQVSFLLKELEVFHLPGDSPPSLSHMHVERVALPPDAPRDYVIGLVFKFLKSRSPRHAGQAEALVDALFIQIGPLGTRTDTCKSFEEIKIRHGYTKTEFNMALGTLEELPDAVAVLDIWLASLASEGMGVVEITGIRSAVTAIYRRQVMGVKSQQDTEAIKQCDKWLSDKSIPNKLTSFFEEGYNQLKNVLTLKRSEILAHFALRAIEKCIV